MMLCYSKRFNLLCLDSSVNDAGWDDSRSEKTEEEDGSRKRSKSHVPNPSFSDELMYSFTEFFPNSLALLPSRIYPNVS